MADIKTPEERSVNMAAIRSYDTKPEVFLRKKLYKQGFRYRKNLSGIVGHPDVYMSKYRTAIFVHGCYWHRHKNCKYAYTPKSRIDFWTKKFEDNVRRDAYVRKALADDCIKCLIIWECTINRMMKSDDYSAEIIDRIKHFITSNQFYLEI